MPKAYDIHDNTGEPRGISDVSVGEIIAGSTLFYACSISAFNAGYFRKIPGRFSDLFTFSDLIGTNISIIQYLVWMYGFIALGYALFSFVVIVLVPSWQGGIKKLAARSLEEAAIGIPLLGGVVAAALLSIICVGVLQDYFGASSLTLALLPLCVWQGPFLYVLWIQYRGSLISLRTFAGWFLVNIFLFSFNAGDAWLKHDTLSASEVQAVLLQDGVCVHRKVLRVSTNGYLLFNVSLKSFEFRNKDTIRTIFDAPNCM